MFRLTRNLMCSVPVLAVILASVPAHGQTGIVNLQIAPSQVELQLGERKMLLVTAYDGAGNVIPNARFDWSVEESVISVRHDPTAPNILYLDGVGYGVTAITVRAGRATADARIRVADAAQGASGAGAGPAAFLRLEPAKVHLLPTEERRLSALFLRADGSMAAPQRANWRSLLPTVASVDARGVAVGISTGQGVIEAVTPTGLTARAIVEVSNTALAFARPALSIAANASDTVRVVVPEHDHRAVRNDQFMWMSTAPQVVTVSPLGVVTALRDGTAEIVVTGFGQQHRLAVTVHQPVETMVVSPDRGTVAVPLGGSVDFTVRMLTAAGQEIPGLPVQWRVSDPAVLQVDPATGRAAGRALGTAVLTATGPGAGLSAEWNVDVVSGGIELDKRVIAAGPGDRIRVLAYHRDPGGKRLSTAAGVRLLSLDPSVVRVVDGSLIEAVGYGGGRVLATADWGAADTAWVFVQGELLVTSTRSGNGDIYALDPDVPGVLHQVTSLEGAELSPAYSPDGARVAFVSTADGNAELYVMDADGSNSRRVTTSPDMEGAPAWTPDGTQLVYELRRKRDVDIWIVSADGSDPRPLTTGARASQPTVSPDGRRVAFRAEVDHEEHIFVMPIDGASPERVSEPGASYQAPAWLADGRLAYIRAGRVGDRRTSIVVRFDLTSGTVEQLTAADVWVQDFAVSHDGALLALIVQTEEKSVRTSRLFLQRVTGAGIPTPIEVARVADDEQFLFPSFKP